MNWAALLYIVPLSLSAAFVVVLAWHIHCWRRLAAWQRNQSELQRQVKEFRLMQAVSTACVEMPDEPSLIEQINQVLSQSLGITITVHSFEEEAPLSEGGFLIQAGERVVGEFRKAEDCPDPISKDDLHLLSVLANQVGMAIERLRVVAAEHRRVVELQAITRLSREINQVLDSDRLLISIARQAAEISDADASGIFFLRPDERFYLVATYGVGSEFVAATNQDGVPVGGSIIGQAVLTRRPVQVPDIACFPNYAVGHLVGIEGIRAILALPMLRRDEPLGGIALWHRKPHTFTPEEEDFLQALAYQCVNAVENARLFEAEREQRRLAVALRETGAALTASLDLNTVLDQLLDQVARLIPYDSANVMLIEDGWIRMARFKGYEVYRENVLKWTRTQHLQLNTMRNLLEMIQSRQPMVIPDVNQYPGWLKLHPEYNVGSWIGAPILNGDEVVAIFYLDKVEPNFYTPEHATTLAAFASQASLALQNAHLYAEVCRRAAHQEALNAVIAAGVQAPDLPRFLETVLDLTLKAVGVEKGGLWIGRLGVLRGLEAGLPGAAIAASKKANYPLDKPILISDIHQAPPASPMAAFVGLLAGFGLESAMSVPVVVGGQWRGILCLASSRPHNWLVEETDLAGAIAYQLGGAVERFNLLAITQEQAGQMQQIMDTVPEGVVLLNELRQIVLANPTAWQYLRSLAGEASFDRPLATLAGYPVDSLLNLYQERPWQELVTQTEAVRIFEVAARPLNTHDQKEGWVLVLRDVTAERENQKRSQMQERLATVGQLASGIAHDFNNIMAAISVYADLLAMEPGMGPSGLERLGTIQKQVQRANSLIRQVLDFSRRSAMEQSSLDLLPFIKELDKLLVRVLPENIRLELTYQPGVYQVKADPTRLQQVFMNLALNSRDAMSAGGRLQFELSRVATAPDQLVLSSTPPPREWICIAIRDTGTGIPPEVLSHIFDPFFTTKPVGQGTGLGLSQVYGIVKQHGGQIDVHSQVGEGTCFSIYLPALETPEPDALPASSPVRRVGSGETILVAEDDLITREALKAMLEAYQYQVLVAANGTQALQMYQQAGSPIRLVISDLVMPEMGGLALYEALEEIQPGIKMLFITGHPLNTDSHALLEKGCVRCLQKPFSIQEFIEILQALLVGA